MTDDSSSRDRPNELDRIACGDMVTRARRLYPDEPAFVVPRADETVSYATFNDLVNQAAHAFRDHGLATGDRIAVVGENSLEFVIAFFASLKAGTVFVPLNPELPAEDVAYELERSEADGVISDPALAEENTDAFDSANVFVLENTAREAEESWLDAPTWFDGYSASEPAAEIEGDDLAMMMFTSGTTGKPKCVKLSHRAIHTSANSWLYVMDIDQGATCSSFMPMYHNAQLTFTTTAVFTASTTVLQREYDPERIVDDIDTYGITKAMGIPVMYRELADLAQEQDRDVTSLQVGAYGNNMTGGTQEHLMDVFGAEFPLLYGSTESYSPVTCWTDTDEQLRKEGDYLGRPVPNCDVGIMDDDGSLLPRGESGEIVVRGPNIMEGYVDPEKTAEAFEYGWYHTGDIGFFDEDGCLKFVDRKKHVIRTGGENVSSQKVEDRLASHADVEGVAVVGLPHERWDEAVTAFVVLSESSETTVEELDEHARDHLAPFEVPKAIELVDDLPRSVGGRAQKHVIEEEYADYYE